MGLRLVLFRCLTALPALLLLGLGVTILMDEGARSNLQRATGTAHLQQQRAAVVLLPLSEGESPNGPGEAAAMRTTRPAVVTTAETPPLRKPPPPPPKDAEPVLSAGVAMPPTVGGPSQQFPHRLPEVPPPVKTLTRHKPATASVRGNLGPAGALTDSKNSDWLKDRWQAAKDMTGSPLPLPVSLEIDLERQSMLTSVVLDWETAYASKYLIELSATGKDGSYKTVKDETAGSSTAASPKHIVHNIKLGDAAKPEDLPVGRFLRITITENGTPWGCSLWEVQAFGFAARR